MNPEYRVAFHLYTADGRRGIEVRERRDGQAYFIEREWVEGTTWKDREGQNEVGPYKSPKEAEAAAIVTAWFSGEGSSLSPSGYGTGEAAMPGSPQNQKRDWVHIILSNVPMRLLAIPAALLLAALVYMVTLAFPSLNKTTVALVTAFIFAALFATFFGGRFSRRR